MDDLQENMTADVKNAGQFTYVSCWTDKAKESIALWKQYTAHDTGVRIELPKHPFKRYDSTKYVDIIKRNTDMNVTYEGETFLTVINYGDMMNKKYSTFTTGEVPLIPIKYTENEDELVPKMVEFHGDKMEIYMERIGICKDSGWEYQNEWRYRIQFFPVNFLEAIRNNCEKYMEECNKIVFLD